jgi:hypothetical protein
MPLSVAALFSLVLTSSAPANRRHAGRAAALLRRLMKVPELAFERALGMSPAALAEYAKRPQRLTLLYRRRRLDSLNPYSISFSDQSPMEGRANKCRGAFCDGCDRPGLVGISRRDRGPIALGLYTAEGWAPAREGGSDRLRAADHDRGVPRQESRFRLRARDVDGFKDHRSS